MAMANVDPTREAVDWRKLEAQACKRIVWKEGRLLLPACLALIVLAVMGMVAWGLFPSVQIDDNAGMFIGLALGGATMAALVCGSMAFAPERETGTDAFLARLPINGGKLARTKIFTATVYFVVSYFLSVAISVGLFAVFFNGKNLLFLIGGTGVLGAMLPLALLAPVVVFLWSLAISRYQKSTLNAVIGAGACAVVAPTVVALFLTLSVEYLGMPEGLAAGLLYGMFPAMIIGLLFVIAYQHGAWLRPSVAGTDRFVVGTKSKTLASLKSNAGFMRSMRSLLWQTFRLHWAGTLVAALACAMYMIAVLVNYNTVVMASGTEWACFGIEYLNDMFAAGMGATAGIFLFARDQRHNSYRFFQQRADYPRRIWLARIAGMCVIGVIVVLVVGVVNQVSYSTTVSQFQTFRMGKAFGDFHDVGIWFGGDYGYGSRYYDAPTFLVTQLSLSYFYWLTFRTATMFFVVAAVGQLVSIFCRHGILNALLGVVFCFLAAFWIRHVNWYQVPVWLYAWPIGLAAFGLSWAYAPAWIRGTRQLSWSIVSVVVMLAVSIGSVLCLRAVRLNEYEQHAFFTDLEELYFNPDKLKAAGDPRFEVAKKIETAKRRIDLAWNDLQEQGLGSTKEQKEKLEFSEAELKLVEEHEDTFVEIANLVTDPNVKYFFAQSPDAAERNRESKVSTLFRILEVYSTAKKNKGEDLFDPLVARYALDANVNTYSGGIYMVDMLAWGEADVRTQEDLKSAIARIESLIESQNYSGRELAIGWAYDAVLERHFNYESGAASGYGEFKWEVERSKRRFANDLLVDFKANWPRGLRKSSSLDSHLRTSNTLTKSHWELEAPMRAKYADLNVEGINYDLSFHYFKRRRLQFIKVRFALAAWKLENGSYPKKLSQLAGGYLSEKETEGYSSWAYYQAGVDKAVVLSSPYDEQRYRSGRNEFLPITKQAVIPAKTPFFLPWPAAPTETGVFVIQTKNENGTEVIDETDPEVGYLMGESSEHHAGWRSVWTVKNYILKE